MNWFKDLFIRKDSQSATLPPVAERKPNISEPVISFVETFKANPKRFKITEVKKPFDPECNFVYLELKLFDRYEKLSWKFSKCFNIPEYEYNYELPWFLTEDEKQYIIRAMEGYYKSRVDVYLDKKAKRKREALKKVYCK